MSKPKTKLMMPIGKRLQARFDQRQHGLAGNSAASQQRAVATITHVGVDFAYCSDVLGEEDRVDGSSFVSVALILLLEGVLAGMWTKESMGAVIRPPGSAVPSVVVLAHFFEQSHLVPQMRLDEPHSVASGGRADGYAAGGHAKRALFVTFSISTRTTRTNRSAPRGMPMRGNPCAAISTAPKMPIVKLASSTIKLQSSRAEFQTALMTPHLPDARTQGTPCGDEVRRQPAMK